MHQLFCSHAFNIKWADFMIIWCYFISRSFVIRSLTAGKNGDGLQIGVKYPAGKWFGGLAVQFRSIYRSSDGGVSHKLTRLWTGFLQRTRPLYMACRGLLLSEGPAGAPTEATVSANVTEMDEVGNTHRGSPFRPGDILDCVWLMKHKISQNPQLHFLLHNEHMVSLST